MGGSIAIVLLVLVLILVVIESSHGRGAAEDSKIFLSSPREEEVNMNIINHHPICFENMASKAFVRVTRLIFLLALFPCKPYSLCLSSGEVIVDEGFGRGGTFFGPFLSVAGDHSRE